MNPTKRNGLEVLLNGVPIGEIKMKPNSHTTKVVDGDGIIPTGEYSMNPEEIRGMIYRRLEREHPGKKIEIRLY